MKPGTRSRSGVARLILAFVLTMIMVMVGLPTTAASADDTHGTATLKVGSNIAVTSSAALTPNTDLTLTATFAVVPGNEDLVPTGSVTFMDGAATLGTATISGRSAVWPGQLVGVTHSITATYAGDGSYTEGTSSPPLTQATPHVTISAPGGADSPLPAGGQASHVSLSAATVAEAAVDYPFTRFGVDFSGIQGLSANDLLLEQDSAGAWTEVPLIDTAGHLSAQLNANGDLPAGGLVSLELRLSARRGAPTGDLMMAVSLANSNDGGFTYPDVLATQSQTFALQDGPVSLPTTTKVSATSVVTAGQTGEVPMSATVTPSSATGAVQFLSDGVMVGASNLSGGVATYRADLPLGSHSISATYVGDSSYATSNDTQALQITVTPPGGSLHAIPPARILDTRTGNGTSTGKPLTIAPNASLVLRVAGRGGVPAEHVSSVAVNVTVVGPLAAGYVTLYPADGPVPEARTVDFPMTATTAGLAMINLSQSGDLSIRNGSTKPVSVLVDVSAWFGQQDESLDGAGRYNSIVPFRLLDTRSTKPVSRLKAGGEVQVQINGASSGSSRIPTTGVSAVMLNVSSVAPANFGYVTVYPGATVRDKTTSTLQYQKSETRAARVIVGVGTNGKVNVYSMTATDVLVDVAGWFTSGSSTAGGGTYVPLPVSRRLTPVQTGGSSVWGVHGLKTIPIAGVVGVDRVTSVTPPRAVVSNLHVTAPTKDSYLTAYPPPAAQPTTSDLVFPAKGLLQNLTIAQLSSAGAFKLFNYNGSVNVVIDVFGWFG